MESHYYREIVGGSIYLSHSINTNISDLKALCNNLKAIGKYLVSYNQEGVIIDDIDVPIITPTELVTIRDDCSTLQVDMSITNNDILNVNDKVNNVQKDIISILGRIDALFNGDKDPELQFPTETPVGEGLYIMYDLLPDKLKQELSIYIKK